MAQSAEFEYSATLGGSLNIPTSETKTIDDGDLSSSFDFHLGTTILYNIKEKIFFRTGAYYLRRGLDLDIGNSTVELTYNSLSLPFALEAELVEKTSFFFGFQYSINFNDTCSTVSGSADCDNVEDSEQTVLDLLVGLSYQLSDSIAIDFYYGHPLSEVSEGISLSTLGLNLQYHFK